MALTETIAEIIQAQTLTSCRAATTAEITLIGSQTIDGVLLVAGDRCIVKNQSDMAENGIYVVRDTAWTRATDMNGTGDIESGAIVTVWDGTLNGESMFTITFVGALVLGATDIAFSRLSDSGASIIRTLADLQSTSNPQDGDVVQLHGRTAGGAGGGQFRFRTGDYSTQVAADEVTTGEGDGGVYIAPGSDKTGASGAWQREEGGAYLASWWGVSTATANNAPLINKACSFVSSIGGGVVELPGGTLTVSDSDADGDAVLLASGVTLAGQGRGVTELFLAADQNSVCCVKLPASSSDMAVRNLTVNGNRDNQSSPNGGLKGIAGSANCDHVTLSGLEVKNVYGRSVLTNEDGAGEDALGDEAEHWNIIDVITEGGGSKGIQARRSKYVNILGCHVTTAGVDDSESDSAFEVSRSRYVTITGNTARHTVANFGPSYRVVNDSAYVTITGNTSLGGRQGLFVTDSSDVVIGNNVIDSPGAAYPAIFIQHTDLGGNGYGPVERVKVHDNIVINPGTEGCYVDVDSANNGTACNTIDICDNTFYDGGNNTMNYGVRVDPGSGTIICRERGNNIINAQVSRLLGTFSNNPPLQVASLTTPETISQNLYSGQVTIADDAVATITPPTSTDTGMLFITVDTVQTFNVLLSWRAGASQQVLEMAGDSANRVDQTTGPLTGTTGTDTNITVSALSDGTLQIENRSGATRNLAYQFIACR